MNKLKKDSFRIQGPLKNVPDLNLQKKSVGNLYMNKENSQLKKNK